MSEDVAVFPLDDHGDDDANDDIRQSLPPELAELVLVRRRHRSLEHVMNATLQCLESFAILASNYQSLYDIFFQVIAAFLGSCVLTALLLKVLTSKFEYKSSWLMAPILVVAFWFLLVLLFRSGILIRLRDFIVYLLSL